ncbi:uncharacterized protein [Chironomus tepperi]|uniref:uncharacterized protein n=1 Tax=Chironomus tepperi TaxID=113505 RepID=UPI00391F3627
MREQLYIKEVQFHKLNKMDPLGDELKCVKLLSIDKKILKLEKNQMTSKDLEQKIDSEITEIHIICDKLSLDTDLTDDYRGKDIFISANQIHIDDNIIWNISGRDGITKFTENASTNEYGIGNKGDDGDAGQNGGNITIICDSIYDYSRWTIISNGGNGSNGQNGGNGADGTDGKIVSLKDFRILSDQITCFNFCQLLSHFCVGTNVGSRHKIFYKDGYEKQIIFNRDSIKSEMIMLVGGSKGKSGQLGGLGGKGGRGGKAGTINVNLKFTANDGCDGLDGLNGFNGRNGKNGNYAYLIVRSTETEPMYVGLDKHLNLQIGYSNDEELNSIYYQPFRKYLYIAESKLDVDDVESIRNTHAAYLEVLESYKKDFFESLINVFKYSNDLFGNILKKLKINEILSKSIEFNNLLQLIFKNSFDVRDYDFLVHNAKCLAGHAIILTTQIPKILQELSFNPQITADKNGIIVMTGNYITSKNVEDIDDYFVELRVICDILHINSNLSDKFRGKNLAITANIIYVHNQTELDLSGHDRFSKWQRPAGADSDGRGIDGDNGEAGESGGNCVIKCDKIINPSLLSIKSNGGDGSNGQNGGDGHSSVDGVNPKIDDFKINEMEINASILRSFRLCRTFNDDGFEKVIYVQSVSNYLMLIKGIKGKAGQKGGVGGRGGIGGYGGQIQIITKSKHEAIEISQQSTAGKNGNDGKNGQSHLNAYTDGHDAVLHVKNGQKMFIGFKQPFNYEIRSSDVEYEHAVRIDDIYYYPVRTHYMEHPNSIFNERNFYENLLSMLRNSKEQFDEVIRKLKLVDFVNYNITLRDVMDHVVRHIFDIPHYKVLQGIASNCKADNNHWTEPIRKCIEEFTKDIVIKTSSTVVTIKKKILRSSEFTSRDFGSNIQEYHVICDTLYIDSDLSSSFHGKNLAILCNFLKVTKPIVWDISGDSGIDFTSDAGHDDTGSGRHGEDGDAGKSGGNFVLECKFIDNGHLLTIISNGGNGSNGQNGGNGLDGANGIDAKESDFYINKVLLKTPLENTSKIISSGKYHHKYGVPFAAVGYERAEYDTNNGLKGFYYKAHAVCIVFVKGSEGEPGKLGGIGGYGGDGGHPGTIQIKCQNVDDNSIKTAANFGKTGQNGVNGLNGLHGRVGGDVHKFDYNLWSEPFIDGHKRYAKFKVARDYGRLDNLLAFFVTAGINQIAQYKIYSDEEQCYIRIEEDKEFILPSTNKYRNDSALSHRKKSHAIANRSSNINHESIKDENSNYLVDSINDVTDTVDEYVHMDTRAIAASPIKNPDINIDQIEMEHENYLMTHAIEVKDTAKMEVELTEVQTSKYDNLKIRQVQYNDSRRKVSQKFKYKSINPSNVNKSPTNPFEFIKMSKLSSHQYLDIIKNIEIFINDVTNRTAFIDHLKEAVNSKSHELDENAKKMAEFEDLFIKEVQKSHSYELFEDVIKLCQQKYLSLIYEDIFNFFNNRKHDSRKFDDISFSSAQFRHQFQFLKDSKEFNSKSSFLNMHFGDDSVKVKGEIWNYFKNNYGNNKSAVAELVLNNLLTNINVHRKISKILINFTEKVKNFDGKPDVRIVSSSDKLVELTPKSPMADEFSDILKDFYDTKDIFAYIKDELKTVGIRSPLYRNLLAHKYGLKFVICRLGLDDKMKVFEWHNYGDGLRFSYEMNEVELPEPSYIARAGQKVMDFFKNGKIEEKQAKNLEEIFIFLNDSRFTVLNFEDQKYKNFIKKEEINKNLKQVALIMEDKESSHNYTFEDEDFQPFLKKIEGKFNFIDNTYAEIFKNDDDGTSNTEADQLYETIISNFPVGIYSNGTENDDEIDKSANLILKSKNREFSKIKSIFRLISKIGGQSVLRAIAIQLTNNQHSHSLEDFSILIKSIFLMLHKRQAFVVPMTFMILGYTPDLWLTEVILTKLDCMFGTLIENYRKGWKQKLLKNTSNHILPILLNRLVSIEKCEDIEVPTIQEFDDIFDNFMYLDDESIEKLKDTSMKLWRLVTTDKYWSINMMELESIKSSLSDDNKLIFEDMSNKYGIKTRKLMELFIDNKDQLSGINMREFANNFNNGKWLFGDNVLKILKDNPVDSWITKLNSFFDSTKDIRTADLITKLMKKDDETSPELRSKVDNISSQYYKVLDHFTAFKDLNESEIHEKLEEKPKVNKLLALILRVFKLIGDIDLRDTQLISIITLLNSGHGVLMQVSTGEGKTFIGVAFAILKVLQGEKIDIVTSSSVLAERDALNPNNKKLFDFFNIKVDHNCHEKADRRKAAYDCDVIYGTLCNFQRDYLLTEFHEQKIMPNHHFKNILVDEVDSMLLDRGNNILYLSQDLPDLDEVESIFIFIWQWINQKIDNFDEMTKILDKKTIRNVVLDTVYGILNEDEIRRMKNDVNAEKVIKILQNLKLIDHECFLNRENFDEEKVISSLKAFDDQLVDRIVKFCKNKFECENLLNFPKHLKDFVFLHLDKWIENAIRAMYLQNGKEYIIDLPKTGNIEKDPDINIIDIDTGTDMSNSQWDEGLHQFLQIKHGCRMSPLSLKSVFISNVSFFKKYSNLYGMTGTLGSLQERKKITKIHNILFVTIPRHVTRKFEEFMTITKTNEREWLDSINKEVKLILDQDRSILIICETILDTQIVHRCIRNTVTADKTILYQRDSDKFDITELKPGYVIISTNLAGRGTDIKLSQELVDKGGLHVILTHLPDNSRIEEQALGRAARSGNKGTGRLILWNTNNELLSKLKEVRNLNELRRIDEISIYYENFIKIEENFFEGFQSAYRDLKKTLPDKEKIFLYNFIVQWSFWLDQNSKLLDDWKNINNSSSLQQNFTKFLSEKKKFHPVVMIEFYKDLVGTARRLGFFSHFLESFIEKINFISNNSKENSEDLLNKEFQDDLFVHQYFKLYGMLRKNQKMSSYRHRKLSKDEQLQIKKCLRMAESIIQNRQLRIEIVKYLKAKAPENMPTINGYENQNQEILQIYEEICQSLRTLRGEDVNPNTLETASIDKFIMKNQLYEELLAVGCIQPPKISDYYSDEDLEIVCRNNKIDKNDLRDFLNLNIIGNLRTFEDKLKNNFKMPSRVEFWDILLNSEILKDEIEFAIVDLIEIKDVDPSAGALIAANYKTETFKDLSSSTVFFALNITSNNDKMAVKMDQLKSDFTAERLNYLLENNVIEINKCATFDMEKYESLADSSIFGVYESITSEDFAKICKNYQKIIDKLADKKYRVLKLQNDGTYTLNYENYEKLSVPYSLGEDYVYQASIYDLIQHKFAYKIAIESLVEDLKFDIKNPLISLEISPHTKLLSDLIHHGIIEQAKVNEDQLHNCDHLFQNRGISHIFESIGFKVDDDFINELEDKELISRSHQILNFDAGRVTLSEKYVKNQRTILLLLQYRYKLIENNNEIKKLLRSYACPLLNKELESIEVVLVPTNVLLPQNDYLAFMDLKGFGSVIKIKHWMYSQLIDRLLPIACYSVLKIIVGVAITFMTTLAATIETPIISEGIKDVIIILSRLQTGYFSWKTYEKSSMEYKISQFFSSLLLAKTKILMGESTLFEVASEVYCEVKELGKTIVDQFSNRSNSEEVMKGNLVGVKKVMKETTKMTVINCKNASMPSTSSAETDLHIQQYLSDVTAKIMDKISEIIQHDYYKHEIKQTIAELLTCYSPGSLKTLIMESIDLACSKFNQIKNIYMQISNTIDTIIHSDPTSSWPADLASIVAKTVETASIPVLVNQMFNIINDFLKEKGSKAAKHPNLDETNKFHVEIVEQLTFEATKHCRHVLNSTVIKPAMTFANNMLVKNAVLGIENMVKDSIEKYRESKFQQKAMSLHEAIEDLTTSSDANENHIPDDLLEEVMEIESKTRNKEVFKKMIKLNIPYDIIGIKCVHSALEVNFDQKFQFIVTKNGNDYIIGDSSDLNVKIINLELIDGHFVNSQNIETGSDSLYYAICDNYPILRDKMTPNDLRCAAADVIDDNDEIKYEIKHNDKEFCMEIKFYDGRHSQVKDKDKIFNYYAMDILNHDRNLKYEVDHIPPKSIYEVYVNEVRIRMRN